MFSKKPDEDDRPREISSDRSIAGFGQDVWYRRIDVRPERILRVRRRAISAQEGGQCRGPRNGPITPPSRSH